MKRLSRRMSTSVLYEPLAATESEGDVAVREKKPILCASTRRRMYVLVLLSGIALMWIFIYYKLLDHKFELPEPLKELQKLFGDGKVKKRRGRYEETENIVTESPRTCLPQFSKERNEEVVHIAIVACKNRVKEALVCMKSIVLVTNHFIHIHIFTDEENFRKRSFEKELSDWPAFRTERWMMFTIHRIHYPIDDNEMLYDWVNLFKPCATQRLFIPSILIGIDSVIYVDTDVLFLKPPDALWKYFKKFNSLQIAGLSNDCENRTKNCWYKRKNEALTHPYVKPYGLNSGVMLMNLTRMRQLNWEKELISIYTHYKFDITWGDQDLLNIYFQKHRNYLFKLSCTWNYRPDHCTHGNTCRKARQGISLLHGSHDSFRNRQVQPEFHEIFEIYRKFQFRKDDFRKDIVSKIRQKLESKGHAYSDCRGMKSAILKYVECYN